jgi:hypothetical protein
LSLGPKWNRTGANPASGLSCRVRHYGYSNISWRFI